MAIHVALFEPQIPANTGNIARTCAGTGDKFHLVKRLGFSTDDKMLKRAGLDYWEHVDIKYHAGIRELSLLILMLHFTFLRSLEKSSYTHSIILMFVRYIFRIW